MNMKLEVIEEFDNFFDREIVNLNLAIDKLLIHNDSKTLRILEAGCGSCSYINMKDNFYLVGIDISEEQLERNNALHEKILGDIQNFQFPEAEFDMIVCWWVLEHVSNPELALNNFLSWLKEDGIIVIAVPNALSIKGLITKYTPHWFHTLIYKYIFGQHNFHPFKTYMRLSISPKCIKQFAIKNNLSLQYFSAYESHFQKVLREKYKITHAKWHLLKKIIQILSFARLEPELTEYIAVLKKHKINIIST